MYYDEYDEYEQFDQVDCEKDQNDIYLQELDRNDISAELDFTFVIEICPFDANGKTLKSRKKCIYDAEALHDYLSVKDQYYPKWANTCGNPVVLAYLNKLYTVCNTTSLYYYRKEIQQIIDSYNLHNQSPRTTQIIGVCLLYKTIKRKY